MNKDGHKKKRGQAPETLEIEGDWENAVKKAIEKKKPKDGWPKKDKK